MQFILPVLVTESCFQDSFFPACSIDLQWNKNSEDAETERLVDIENDPRDRQASKDVDGVANSRIEAVSDEGLSLRADGE